MTSLTSSLKISLIDDVSKPAKSVAAALRQAETNAKSIAKAMSGAGATDRFVGNLAKLKLSAKDIQAVSKAWQDYAKSAGLAARSSDWTKAQQAQVRQWESNTIRALRHVKAEQSAFHRAQARAAALAATPGGGGIGGAMTAGGVVGALRGEKFRAGAAEAASRVSPSAGYLIGAGGAVMAGAAIGGTAAAGIGAGAISVKEAIARNKAETDIRKKVDLAPGETMEMKARQIAAVSRKMGMSYSDAAAIFAQGGQGGIASKDLADFAMLGAKVSTAWDIGTKEAAQMLTEVRAQTKWTIPQLEQFADKVNYLGDISAAAEKDIGVMWQRSSAGAKAAGVSYDDSLVTMTALRSVGMQDEVAARFFGQFTSRLRTATSQSKDAQAAFKELGMSAKGLEEGMKTDAMGTMVDFLQRLSKAKNPVKIALGVGGKEWQDEIMLFTQALSELVRLTDALHKKGGAEGSLQKALDADLAATETKLKRAYQSILDIGAQFAKPALPWIDSIADKWVSAAERLERATERARIVAKAGAGQLTPEEQKKVDADPELKRQVQNKIWSAPKGRSIEEYERQHRIGDPRKASTEEINRALPFARHNLDRFDPQRIWARPEPKKKRRKGPPPVPTFASGAPRPESSVLEPTPRPLPKNAPLPPRRPKMAPQTDHAPEIGGSVPAFASSSGVTPKVDTSQIDAVAPKADAAKAALEGLGVSVTPNVNAGPVEHLRSAAEGAKQAIDGLGVHVAPSVDSAPVEGLRTSADGAKVSLEGLNTTVAPHVDASSIHSAISAADTLLSKLNAIRSGAAAAGAAVNQASAAARAAASRLPTMAQTNRGSYSAAGDPAGK